MTTRGDHRQRSGAWGAALFLSAVLVAGCNGASPSSRRVETRETLAAQAYVWGVPLVVSTRTYASLARLIGVNQLFWQSRLADPSTRLIVAPNVDTLYSVAVLDLRGGPMSLTVPAVTDRYYTYQFLDSWTEAFAYVGTRATGGRAGTWVITPPGWNGAIPAGASRISAPTPLVFLLGRFLVHDESDIANVATIRQRVRLDPLGASTRPPPLAPASGTPQGVAQAGASFFDELGDDLVLDPPTSARDRAALTRFASLGVAAGRHPAGSTTREALARGVVPGEAQITAATAAAKVVNGWSTRLDVGRYGSDFMLRAAVARTAWGANIAAEAVYPVSRNDAGSRPYSGSSRYVMHFDAGALPPVRAFWSLTLYGLDGFLVPNNAHRYAIGDRTPSLRRNADGSLDIFIQHDPPPGHEGNWLPSPSAPFTLMTRMYLPEPAVLDGQYRLPGVQRVG
jgi:hypothetical protein